MIRNFCKGPREQRCQSSRWSRWLRRGTSGTAGVRLEVVLRSPQRSSRQNRPCCRGVRSHVPCCEPCCSSSHLSMSVPRNVRERKTSTERRTSIRRPWTRGGIEGLERNLERITAEALQMSLEARAALAMAIEMSEFARKLSLNPGRQAGFRIWAYGAGFP